MEARRLLRYVPVILGVIFLVFFIVSGYLLVAGRLAVAHLEDRIALLKAEYVPLRFMVLSRSDQSVSARFRFYDADGREVAAFERSWNGSELAIDSVVVPVGDRALVFPARVFTDATAPRRGTELFSYYDRDGFPAIFDSSTLDKGLRSSLSELFGRVKSAEGPGDKPGVSSDAPPVNGSYGNAVHDLKRLREFEVGGVYSLTARYKGGIEIIRE